MLEVVLTYPTDDGSEEVFFDDDKISFGRGSEAEHRFEDDGLSRLHATIYREDDYVWVVDEYSSNGTYVNGEKVGSNGTPLEDGDTIKIGHYTNIKVRIQEKAYGAEPSTNPTATDAKTLSSANTDEEKPSMLIPLLIMGFAFLVIFSAVAFVGILMLGDNEPDIAQTTPKDDGGFDEDIFGLPNDDGSDDENPTNGTSNDGTVTPIDGQTSSLNPTGVDTTAQSDPSDTNITDSPTATKNDTRTSLPSGKTYQQMSEEEKNRYVAIKAKKVAEIIGNNSSQSIPPAAVVQIRKWLDGYTRRIRSNRKNDCSMGGWLSSDTVSILERARGNAPFIVREFNKKDVSPYVGIYLAFIESEHCPCLQSNTGPLGLFQFTTATGRAHGLNTRRSATPSSPDERCQKEPAAKAAASYMKTLTARIGTGSLSIPLAIASYNSGEGGLGKNLKTALTANESQERSFWTLVANKQILVEQFKKENIKYVPKFFGAAIIGENPKDFGINMLSLSSYTK